MSNKNPPRILIAGAGPTGLTAAVELARQGIVPDIIEKRNNPSPLSRAVGILPASMDILAPSGVAEEIRAEAIVVRRAIFHHNTRKLGTLEFDPAEHPHQRLLALPQDRTEAHLKTAFERYGGKVQYGIALDRFEQHSESVTASLGSTTSDYDYLIGADGVHSRVRKGMGVDYSGYELPETWSIADVYSESWPHAEEFCVYLCDHGRVVIVVPLETARYRVISNTDDALQTLPAEMLTDSIYRQGRFRLSIRQASQYRRGRVFLAGDAAHCHSPVGGRGMNLGIADASDLAQRLVYGGLERYHGTRHPVGMQIIRITERGRRLVCSTSRFKRGILFGLTQGITRIPAFQKRFVATVLEM